MQPVFDNNVVIPKSTGFDKAAKYSFLLSIPFPFVAFLIFIAAYSLFPNFMQTLMQSGIIFSVGLICVSVCGVIGFVLGVVSLFGNRTQPSSFSLALFGTLVGGILGFGGFLLIFGFSSIGSLG
jgi:hypothetical protein